MKRRELIVALAAGLASPLASLAQQDKIRRIGFLGVRSRSTPSNPDVYYDAFVQGMRELGYVEGKNLAIEWRFAEGRYDRLPGLAAELVQANVEVIVTHATPPTRALQRATSVIPIVFAAVGNPVGSGFAASLARPGRNLTGLSNVTTDILPKRLELLKSILPKVSRVAFLLNPANSDNLIQSKIFQQAAGQLGWKAVMFEARTREEISRGFTTATEAGAEAVIVSADPFFILCRRQILELSMQHRIPVMMAFREDVKAGALVSYGQNTTDFYRRAAAYVDKILQGAKPSLLPIEQPTKIHLAINLKTAKALGISVPEGLVFRADEVFE